VNIVGFVRKIVDFMMPSHLLNFGSNLLKKALKFLKKVLSFLNFPGVIFDSFVDFHFKKRVTRRIELYESGKCCEEFSLYEKSEESHHQQENHRRSRSSTGGGRGDAAGFTVVSEEGGEGSVGTESEDRTSGDTVAKAIGSSPSGPEKNDGGTSSFVQTHSVFSTFKHQREHQRKINPDIVDVNNDDSSDYSSGNYSQQNSIENSNESSISRGHFRTTSASPPSTNQHRSKVYPNRWDWANRKSSNRRDDEIQAIDEMTNNKYFSTESQRLLKPVPPHLTSFMTVREKEMKKQERQNREEKRMTCLTNTSGIWAVFRSIFDMVAKW
jgi:hypothetical protein